MKIAFLYEHPTWSDTLIHAFTQKGIELHLINVAQHVFDTTTTSCEFDAAINRVNIMPSDQRNPNIVFHTLHYLHWLELCGVPIINGSRAHTIGCSKALQNGIFSSLELPFPRGIAVYGASDIVHAARQIGYPVITKPNIGGSGSGINLYQNENELQLAVKNKMVDLGVDGTGITQEYIESDGFVYRVEVLGDELFYNIRQPIQQGQFNYCAADGCATDTGNIDADYCVISGSPSIETFNLPDQILTDVVRIIQACNAQVGGVEYFIDAKTGRACFYDFNPYSNFIGNGQTLLGFAPEDRYVDFVMQTLNAS